MEKIKHNNNNFKTGLYYMQINITYIIWTKEIGVTGGPQYYLRGYRHSKRAVDLFSCPKII